MSRRPVAAGVEKEGELKSSCCGGRREEEEAGVISAASGVAEAPEPARPLRDGGVATVAEAARRAASEGDGEADKPECGRGIEVAGEASKLEFASEAGEHAEDESVCSSSSLWHRARRRRDLAKARHSERDVSTAAIERDTSFKKEERTEEVW